MSTKALRQLIQSGQHEVLPLDRVVREALAEVEAIERAAVWRSGPATKPMGSAAGTVMGRLDDIAAEVIARSKP